MRFLVIISFLFVVGSMLPFEAAALTVSPVRVELTGDPGTVIEGELILTNEQEVTRTFYSSFGNFEATGETGTPSFVPGEEGLATWIEAAPSITLGPGEEKKVPYTIAIPQDADPGGHFAAIFWGTSPPKTEEGGQISVGAKIGVLILLRVTGEIEEEGGILEFSTKGKQKFFSSLPVTLIYRFQNSGDDRVKPEGEVTIRNIFNRTLAVLPANKSEGNVLPHSIRKFEVVWESEGKDTNFEEAQSDTKTGFFGSVKKQWKDFHFGRYTAELKLKYGVENEEVTANYNFFVIPWQLLSVIIVVIAVIGFLGIIGIKRYNRWIIAKAKAK